MSVNLAIGSDTYRMDVFPLPAEASVGANPQPLDIAIGGGKAWLCCEFSRHMFSVPLDAGDGAEMTPYAVPVTSEPIFRSTLFGADLATDCTGFEDIDIDGSGNVWVTQMGQSLYGGAENNFGRVLRYKPGDESWLAYPLPWNNAAACGVLVDGLRVWATGWAPHAALAVMKPATWRTEHTDPESAAWPPCDEFGGWSRSPAGAGASHMAIGPDSRLYVCNYNAASVTAYDRTTLAAQTYALPAGSEKPWQIAFDFGGGCWVSCDTTRQLAKLNPATGAWTVYATGLASNENAHSLALQSGAWWFTAYCAEGVDGGRIGRRTSAGAMELSATLDSLGFPKGATGIAVDGATGCVWVALFGSKAVGRMTKL